MLFTGICLVGRLFAALPEGVMHAICRAIGLLFFYLPSRRRRLIESNLHHAFPEKPADWHHRITRAICLRTVEMGLFTLTVPFFSKKRYESQLEIPQKSEALLGQMVKEQLPVLLLGTHCSMIEAFNAFPANTSISVPGCTIMYRPHKNPKIDALIKQHRERCGFRMVSRKEGIRTIGEELRKKAWGILLFDQNTRDAGSLMPFFGRVTSATELPALLCHKYRAVPIGSLCHRRAFWKASILLERLDPGSSPAELTLDMNRWLEDKLRGDESLLVDWLWSHNRWKILHQPHERLGMVHKKHLVDFSTYPEKRTRFALMLPEFKSFKTKTLEFLETLRKSRPDASLTLIGADAASFLKDHPSIAEHAIDLPRGSRNQKNLAKQLKRSFLDLILLPVPDPICLKLAAQSGTIQRFGLIPSGQRKPKALSHVWAAPEGQLDDWLAFGRHFGMQTPEPHDRTSHP
jgi:lauroyl/myristoyl acyltransferase